MASKKRSKFPLDEETLGYYKNVSAMFNDKSQEQSEKDVLIDNVLGQLEEEAVKVCQCPQTSPIVEDLIAMAPLPHLTKLFQILHKDWQVLCTSPAASHILERIITVLPKFISKSVADKDVMSSVKNREDENVNDTVKLIRLLMDVSDLMLEDLEDVFTHVYYSHVLRTLLQVLGGTRVGESLLKSRTSRERSKEVHSKQDSSFVHSKQDLSFTDFSVPSAFLKKLKHIAKSIFEMDNISKFLTDSNGSPVIQTLLLVLHKCDFDLCQKYIHKVIQSSRIKEVGTVHDPESANLPPVAADSVGSFLIELILSLTSKETFNELYEELFQGRLFQFSIHPKANFVLQRLIKGCADKEMFEKLFDELNPHLEDILAANHLGVAVALAESCQKLGVKQGKFKNSLMQAFHCLEPEESQLMFVSCLLSFTTYELLSNGQDVSNMPLLNTFNYHGSMLLQQLLKFSKTKYIVKSFLSLRPAEFRNMASDPCGSHVINKFIVAEGIKEKHKDALLNKLKGCYVDLACHKNGSRTLEDIWKNLSAKQKALVATELCEKESKLLSDRYGCFVHRNFALNHFKKRRNDWMELQGSEQRKRQMFREFLDSPSEMRPKKIFKQEAVSRKTWKKGN